MKRKLSRRQAWRIKKIQRERLERARRKSERLLETIAGNPLGLGPEQQGLVIANYGATLDVKAEDGGV